MRRPMVLIPLALLCRGACAATLTAATPAQWQALKPQAGDTVQLAADISLPCDSPLKSGVTYDLGGKTVTFPKFLPDGVRPSRGFSVEGGNIVVKNGSVQDAGWCFYAFYSASGFAFQDLRADGVKCFLKLAATPLAVVDNVRLRGIRVRCVDAQYTILDIGPGRCSGVTVEDYRSVAPVGGANNTGADGIALENPTDTPVFRDVVVDGAAGDGLDIKGPATLENVYVTHATRQTIKVWGRKDKPTTMTGCAGVNSGMGGMCNAGAVTMTDCYFEGGTSDSTAFFWGVGKVYDPARKDQWGNVDDYGCGGVAATVTRCKFIRHAGASVLLTAEPAAVMSFQDCTFWQQNHPNLFTGPLYVSVDAAKAGQWPAAWTGSQWADAAVPAVPAVDDPPIIEPPVVDPPAWALTEEAWAAATRRLVELEAKLAALQAWQKRLADSFR